MGDDSSDASAEQTGGYEHTQPAADAGAADSSDAGDLTSANSLFSELMNLYDQQNWAEAISKAHALIQHLESGMPDDTGGAPWTIARAKYGIVMCYDSLNDPTNAGAELQALLRNELAGHPNLQAYQRQLAGYQAGNRWQGDPLGV